MTYQITLHPSGRTFACEPDQEVLSAGLAAGIVLPYSCRSGACTVCRGEILEGDVNYERPPMRELLLDDGGSGRPALLCRARPSSDLVVGVHELTLASSRAKSLPCRLMTIEDAARDVKVCTFKLPEAEHMRFAPGQYVDFLVDGRRRSYSLARQCPPEGVVEIEIHVRHLPGGFLTDQLFDGGIKRRQVMRLEGPFGTFYLREDSDKPIVMVCSGTGFAPIKAICEQALGRRLEETRPITLYWGCRQLDDLYMLDLPQRWAEEREGFRFVPVLSEPRAEDNWSGRTGLVHQAVMADFPDLSGHQVYACGAPIMVDSARADFVAHRGLPPDEFLADAFITEAEKQSA